MSRRCLLLLLPLSLAIMVLGRSAAGMKPVQAAVPTLALVAPPDPQPAMGTIEVQVVITGGLSLGAFEFDLEYDRSLVQVTGMTVQEFLGQEAECDAYAGRCAVTLGPLDQDSTTATGAYTYGTGTGATGDGVLAVLQLRPTGEGGTTLLHLANALITDSEANPATPSTEDATLTLEPSYLVYLPLISKAHSSAQWLAGPVPHAVGPQAIPFDMTIAASEAVTGEICLDFAYPAGVGAEDMQAAAAHWRQQSTDSGWDARFDLDGDENVDVADIMQVSADWSIMCLPHTSTEVGPAGATIQLDGFDVIIPSGLLSETVVITATELPTQTDEVAEDLDPARFQPLEPGFELQASFASAEPLTLTLSYEEGDIPDGFDPQNLGVLLRVDPYLENPGGDQPEEAPEWVFCPLPATVDEGARQVQLEIHGGGPYQLVAMAEPLDVVQGPAITESLDVSLEELAGVQQLFPVHPFRIIWVDEPAGIDKAAFEAQAFGGLNAALQIFVLQQGFPAPAAQVTVALKRISGPRTFAGVARSNPLIIVADPFKSYSIQSVMAHEYFHIIQLWNSNLPSSLDSGGDANRWFAEGTASWAQDEVFDVAFPGHYLAPTGERFTIPLNKSVPRSDNAAYETVAFWKWLESQAPGSILAITQDHLARTHSSTSAATRVRNSVQALYLDSLKAVHPDLNFLVFAESALYWKDFDTNETGIGDLWHADKLGGVKDVPAYFRDPAHGRVIQLKKGDEGDSAANPREILYPLVRHLTADVELITNGEGSEALGGTLHLQFAPTTDPEVQVAIISRESDTSGARWLTDLSSQREERVPFSRDSEVVVIPVAPQWEAPDSSGNQVFNTLNVWVEPCGGETKDITDVSSVQEMYDALAAASPGDTIRLAPGTYTLTARNWPGIGPYTSLVIDKEVTLAGWGPGQTTIVLWGANANIRLQYESAKATFRDLRILSYADYGFLGSGATRVSFCNVLAEFGSSTEWGLQYNPFDAGGFLEVQGTTFSCPSCNATAFEIYPYAATEPRVDVFIRDSAISGWRTGVEYCTGRGCGHVTVDADCDDFSVTLYDILVCGDGGCVDLCAPGP